MPTTETAAFRSDGKPTVHEVIYAAGAIFTNVNGKWIRSTITPEEMFQQKQENREQGKGTCHYVRDESIAGEPTSVYRVRSQTPDFISDAQVWISKSKGLPVREELNIDVGGKAGKSHREMRYEYGDIQPPSVDSGVAGRR